MNRAFGVDEYARSSNGHQRRERRGRMRPRRLTVLRWVGAAGVLALALFVGLAGPRTATGTHSHPPLPLSDAEVDDVNPCKTPVAGTELAIDDNDPQNADDRVVGATGNRYLDGSNGPVAIWANADQDFEELTLDISGSRNVVNGDAVSRSHLKISSSDSVFLHATEYGTRSKADKAAFDLSGQNNCFGKEPEQVPRNSSLGTPTGAFPQAPAGFPLNGQFDPDGNGNILEHFLDSEPDGAAELPEIDTYVTNGQYYQCTTTVNTIPPPLICNNGDVSLGGSGAIATGLYYVQGGISFGPSNLTATMTVVAGGLIDVSGSSQANFNPFHKKLLFATQLGTANTTIGNPALKTGGSSSEFRGITVATNGRNELSGQLNSWTCPVMGDRVKLNGSNLYVGTEGCAGPATVVTQIHKGIDHDEDIIGDTIEVGTSIHDKVTVSSTSGSPLTGTITVRQFNNGTCDGTAAATATYEDGAGPPGDAGGTYVSATTVAIDPVLTFTPTTGTFSYRATYSGDPANPGEVIGACEGPVRVVDAKITIEGAATNEVGQNHTFTVTVQADDGSGGGFAAATDGHVDVTLVNSNGAASAVNAGLSTCDDAGDNLNASGQCVTVFTSPSAGQVTGNASVTLTVGGLTITRDTDPATPAGAGPGGSGPVVKTFVDAEITIGQSETNEVGQPHTFTVSVKVNAGLGAGFVAAGEGDVTFSLADSNGAVSVLDATGTTCDDGQPTLPDNLDAGGQCVVVFSSQSAGQVTGNASVSVVVGGLTLTRDTDPTTAGVPAGPGGSGPAVKTYIDAKISIAASETNEVGQPHTFTVTVQLDAGNGQSFQPATDGNVDVTLTDSNGAVSVPDDATSTCDDNQPSGDNLDASGQCTRVFTSNSAGQVTGSATVTLLVGGITVTRSTDGVAPNSGPAIKTFVDANITITPTETNEVGQPHTFTVTVQQNDGSGGGYVAATVGNVDVTLADTNGAVSVLDAAASTCDDNQPSGDNLDASGQCVVVFTSASAGQVTGNASVTLTVGGLTLTRDTDPATTGVPAGTGGSGPAVKTYVDASITIAASAANEVGQPHTFTVTVLQNAGDGAGLVAAPIGNVDVTLSNANGAVAVLDAAASTCDDNQPSGDNLDDAGKCVVVFTSASAGIVTGNASVTLTVGGLTLTRDTDPATAGVGAGPGGSGPAIKTFVNARISLDPLTSSNPVGSNHTVTVDVEIDPGTGFVNATEGDVTWTLNDSGGANSTFNAALSTCDDGQATLPDNLNDLGRCTIVFSSSTAGTTTVNATVSVVVGGVTITRTTGTAANTAAGGSGDATKTWVAGATLLIIDEDSIDNGIHFNASGGLITPSGPQFFGDRDVNDDRPGTRQRTVLRYFTGDNIGDLITVKTGQTGDEGWFAPTCIPQKWVNGTSNTCLEGAARQTGIGNYFGANGSSAIPAQSRLDKIPAVMPLRSLGLTSLVGRKICAVVYDSDISINYNSNNFPFTDGNLQGETLGVISFTVRQVRQLDGFSSSTLPQVTLEIENAVGCNPSELFNAPVPTSSSVPNDRLVPPSTSGYQQTKTFPSLPLFF